MHKRELIKYVTIGALASALLVVFGTLCIHYVGGPVRVDDGFKSYLLNDARVTLTLEPAGSVAVTEAITFQFDGPFTGAFRDIPVRKGDEISDVVVCQSNESGAGTPPAIPSGQLACPSTMRPMTSGGNTELGGFDIPGRFGTEEVTHDGRRYVRVVWHYVASAPTTFAIRYRAKGWVEEYADNDDVVSVTATLWGDEWKASLLHLDALVIGPGRKESPRSHVRAAASGSATVATTRAGQLALDATGIAPQERVDLYFELPRSTFARNASIDRAPESLADVRERVDAEADDSQERADMWQQLSSDPLTTVAIAMLVGLLVGTLWVIGHWNWRLREEPWPEDVSRLRTDPPSDLEPVLASALINQQRTLPRHGLVATIFDLIRRDMWQTLPAQSGRKGRHVDIALKVPAHGHPDLELTPYESVAVQMIDLIVEKHPDGVALGDVRATLKRDSALADDVWLKENNFSNAVSQAIRDHRWYAPPHRRALVLPLVTAYAATIAITIAVLASGPVLFASGPLHTAMGTHVVALLLGIAIPLQLAVASRTLTTRWTSSARHTAAQWTAYANFLHRYGDMEDEQTASIELWERHLCYAIAFGCAAEVLAAVRPEGAEQHSRHAALAGMNYATLSTFNDGMATSAPASSGGGGGGGGGFSGGGFGGGGGGGGGAW